MSNWIVIPVKAPDQCKTRLRAALTDSGRRTLVHQMLRHVVGAAQAVEGATVLLLGPSRHDLPSSMPLLPDAGRDLNDAVASATRTALAAKVTRLVFVAADLPHVTRADIETLLDVTQECVRLAPDRAGTGTNALALPLPRAAGFHFSYGLDSLRCHHGEAARLGLRAHLVHSPGLGFDVDTAEDLAALAA